MEGNCKALQIMERTGGYCRVYHLTKSTALQKILGILIKNKLASFQCLDHINSLYKNFITMTGSEGLYI